MSATRYLWNLNDANGTDDENDRGRGNPVSPGNVIRVCWSRDPWCARQCAREMGEAPRQSACGSRLQATLERRRLRAFRRERRKWSRHRESAGCIIAIVGLRNSVHALPSNHEQRNASALVPRLGRIRGNLSSKPRPHLLANRSDSRWPQFVMPRAAPMTFPGETSGGTAAPQGHAARAWDGACHDSV